MIMNYINLIMELVELLKKVTSANTSGSIKVKGFEVFH